MQYIIPQTEVSIQLIDDFKPPRDNVKNAPKDTLVVGMHLEDASLSVISIEKANDHMPYYDPMLVVDSIHKDLTDEQGLIEVVSGRTVKGYPFLYSIVKNQIKPSGMDYILSMDISFDSDIVHLQGDFVEKGTTGRREVAVLNIIKKKFNNFDYERYWSRDHYDPNYKKGNLMNISENEYWDDLDRSHPLSVCRFFVSNFIYMN